MRRLLMLGVVAYLSVAGTAAGQYGTPKKSAPVAESAATEATTKAAEKILVDLAERGEIGPARREADALLKRIVAEKGTAGDMLAAARVRRVVMLIEAGCKVEPKTEPKSGIKVKDNGGKSQTGNDQAGREKESGSIKPVVVKRMASLMIASPRFADALAWNFDIKRDSGPGVLKVVDDFIAAKADLESHAELAAAVALVHDQPNPRKQAWSFDHMSAFEYFATGSFRPFSPAKMPVCLLVHLVDMVVGTEEASWVKKNLGPQNQVGKRYFDVQYDTMSFKHGKDKKIKDKFYTLQNLRQHGGVCVEQAYYAEQVGKASGIPSVSITARGVDVGHAWVGYLRSNGKGYWWDMTEGRYKEYKGEAASVRDPQTDETISDGELSMVAERAMWDQDAVRLCLALSDAASVAAEPAEALDLCERAVKACHYVPEAWERVQELATKRGFAQADLEKWGGAVVTMCGTTYPDFAHKVLEPLVKTMPKPLERAPAWAWVRTKLVDSQRNRSIFRYDLAVKLLVLEADSLRDGGNLDGAWGIYRSCIEKYAQETPAVQEAGMRCERLLNEGGKGPREAAAFWRWAWGKTEEPDDMSAQFARGSNWSVFGLRYAAALEASGDTNGADRLRNKISPKKNK